MATRSDGKLRELRALFASAGLRVTDLREAGLEERAEENDLESARTFEDNALAKARYFHARSGAPTIADDSGLEVAALGGAPGVLSKRWSGRDLDGQALDDANNALLIERLATHDDRRASYVCAAAYCDARDTFVMRGETAGRIARVPRGKAGFGYDPYFESDELGRTFAEVTMAEKALVSHRARAFAALLSRLQRASRG
ncbi:MAG: non-canonical purine NTP pyrophosphatase [Gemmatimonadaceae bacterium]